MLVLYHLNNPLTNYFCSAYCDWMQTLGPEELQMSVSYGIKPNWAVVLRTKENIHQLAYNLQVVEKVITIMDDPQQFFHMDEVETRKVAKMILPILVGDTWNYEEKRRMTDEEARGVGFLIYPLGHHKLDNLPAQGQLPDLHCGEQSCRHGTSIKEGLVALSPFLQAAPAV